jgi:hypothetical protein
VKLIRSSWFLILLASSTASSDIANSGPLEIILNPSPQEFSNTCQSYSMALGVSLNPSSPFKADQAAELRDLERRIRQALVVSAQKGGRTARQLERIGVPRSK